MRRPDLTLAALLAVFIYAPWASAGPSQPLADVSTLGDPITVDAVPELTLFPMIAKAPEADPGYLTLDAALDGKQLAIKETDTSGRVNTLHVTNNADRPIYALAGEVLLGGKQDRIVGQHTLIPPGVKDFAIPVFCVEHGRWRQAGDGLEFGSAKTLAHTKLRYQAQTGQQSNVWAEVAASNANRKTQNDSDTYREAISKGEIMKLADPATKALLARTATQGQMAGVVVAIDGEVKGMDWFASPGLYRRLEGKLIGSYVAEALEGRASRGGEVKAAEATPKAAQTFVNDADTAHVRAEKASGQGKVFDFEGAEVEGSMVVDAPEAAPVHRSYFKKSPAPVQVQEQMQEQRQMRQYSPTSIPNFEPVEQRR
ncbi:MAG: ARPP-1 family domain-containing protein [Bradymonadia bacterium]